MMVALALPWAPPHLIWLWGHYFDIQCILGTFYPGGIHPAQGLTTADSIHKIDRQDK